MRAPQLTSTRPVRMLARRNVLDEAMCLIAFAWQPDQACPLVVAANRDEFHDRPAAGMAWWDDAPDILGGRDLRAGGTWLGASRRGRFAALTNYREMQQTPDGAPSRGDLVAGFLRSDQSPELYAEQVDLDRYAGFSLLMFDGQNFCFLANREAAGLHQIEPGAHALSNGALDSPWPKVQRARDALDQLVQSNEGATALLDMMGQTAPAADAALPDTGVGIELERFLSPMFIQGDQYGTRASTALCWFADGRVEMAERSFGPGGVTLGESLVEFTVSRP